MAKFAPKISGENRALIEKHTPTLLWTAEPPYLSWEALERLLDAAREEGRQQMRDYAEEEALAAFISSKGRE